MHISGNCYKVRLTARQLGIWLTLRDYGLHDGSTRVPEFLAKNPNGRVPLLELDDGRFLAESGAIIWYLSEGSKLLPDNNWDRAQAHQWMFFEQYSHEPAIAVRRALSVYPERRAEATPARMAQLLDAGNRALGVLERRLASAEWLAGGGFSLADISLYAYTHMAGDGGYELTAFPGVLHWLARVAALPGHVTIEAS
jgi:glutathione S-transferase